MELVRASRPAAEEFLWVAAATIAATAGCALLALLVLRGSFGGESGMAVVVALIYSGAPAIALGNSPYGSREP